MLWRQYRALHLIKKWLLFKVSWSKSFINQATLLQTYLCGENPTHNCTHMIWTQLSHCINSTLHSSLWAKKSPCFATSLISEHGSQWEVSLSLKTPVYVCDLFIYHVLTTRITTDNGVGWTGLLGAVVPIIFPILDCLLIFFTFGSISVCSICPFQNTSITLSGSEDIFALWSSVHSHSHSGAI